MTWTPSQQAQLECCEVAKQVDTVAAMACEAAVHKVECASATLSDHDDDTGMPSSPARSPDSHTTNLGRGALSGGPAVVLQQGDYTSPTTSTSGADAALQEKVQPSALSEVTAHLLLAQSSTAAAQLALACNRSTAASPAVCAEPVAMEQFKEEQDGEEQVPRQPRSKRAKRLRTAPLMEVLITLHPTSTAAPPPVVVNGARLAPHIACKVAAQQATATHLRSGCSMLQRGDSSEITKRTSARLANIPMPAAAACDRAREFGPGEPNPDTLSRACRFLLRQDDYCNAATHASRRPAAHSNTVTVVSDMRHQHRHGEANGEPVPMQFIEHVLQECTTWMCP